MADKFDQRNELCKSVKNQEIWCQNVIMEDIFVLWDTVQELSNNIDKFFKAWWNTIQFIDWIRIEKLSPKKILSSNNKHGI